MTDTSSAIAFVRREEAPQLPAPANTVGIKGWLLTNLFSTWFNSAITIVLALFLFWIASGILDFALFNATWTGNNRESCLGENAGACWPLVADKFPQWVYGFYPIEERWRPNLVFLIGGAALVPMLIPQVPFKKWNSLFLLIVFPLITVVLLTGGNFGFDAGTYLAIAGLLLFAAAFLPALTDGLDGLMEKNRWGMVAAGLAAFPFVLVLLIIALVALLGFLASIAGWLFLPTAFQRPFELAIAGLRVVQSAILEIPFLPYVLGGLVLVAAGFSFYRLLSDSGRQGGAIILGWVGIALAILLAAAFLGFDFGLVPVETSQWGGLLVTLVVASTGIVASLPIGILLALGRRSQMPVVKLFSVLFIELWRGVPLITVLFMSSVMLPLFLPEGTTFDKLLRALIGVALFSAAYMAEVVRSGLQAIPRGQYEGSMALGLSYWQTMNKIILPQALKISIPNIVGNFISLFKDTTLVAIIGLFDLFGIVRAGLKDSNWATPTTVTTGYLSLALLFWIFCFGMSRYAMYTERRLHTGHKR